MRLLGWASISALLAAGTSAWGQVELVDPDAPSVRAPKKDSRKTGAVNAVDPDQPTPSKGRPNPDEETTDLDETTEPERPVGKTGRDAKEPRDRDARDDAKEPRKDVKELPPLNPKKEPPPRPPPPSLVAVTITDAELVTAWDGWRRAAASADVQAEKTARAELLSLKRRMGASNCETWSMGLLRASAAKEALGDSGAAVEMAITATELAPELPSAWTGLALAYFRADPTEIGRYVEALRDAVTREFVDPRYLRPVLADVGTTLLLALLGTTLAVTVVLMLRRASYFLYDFHFFFPRAAARWQSAAMAVILISLPIIFRIGVVPSLLVFFAVITVYLSLAERLVLGALIASLGLIPTVGGWLVDRSAFAGTRAEVVYLLDRGGPGLQAQEREVAELATDDKATFAELAALGRYELRRGKLEGAVRHLQKALTLKNDSRAKTNLAVALLLQGDLENARSVLEGITKEDPSLGVTWFNLGRVFARRFQLLGDASALDVDRSIQAHFEARQRDATLDVRSEENQPVPAQLQANLWLKTAPVQTEELLSLATTPDVAKRVRSQLSQMLLGGMSEGLAAVYPLLIAALLIGVGSLARRVEAARPCNKCGRPVSRRGDPDLSPGSPMCMQCVNVFARKNAVAPSQKVRKQLEVARYQGRIERTSYALGFLFSGMGHVFGGWPVRGTMYGFVFLTVVVGVVLRNGVLRAPYEALPLVVRLAPLVVVFAAVYLSSLRGLRKRQG